MTTDGRLSELRKAANRADVHPGPSVRVVSGRAYEPGTSPAPVAPHRRPKPVLPKIPAKRPVGSDSGILHFDELAEAPPPGSRPAAAAPTNLKWAAFSALLRRGRDAFEVLWHRRRVGNVLAASVLLLAALAGVITSLDRGSASRPSHTRGPTPAGHSAAAPPHPTAGGASQQGLAPPAASFEMTSTESAVYRVTGPISVVLDASGSCWVQARSAGPGGGLLFEGTLLPGRTWSAAGPTWLRLGDPAAVNLTVNGAKVTPPSTPGVPFDLQIG
ncbi:MAG TPA: DUF4115 domain-containing protein [Acidimicrobiales bacterium]|nr:DUF4115 domain-containing protein [Acidimicrobiales bacterium]